MVSIHGKDQFYDSLETIYEQVKDYGFILIHKSFLINHRYIKVISYDSVMMADDTEFPISQMRRNEVREKYFKLEKDFYDLKMHKTVFEIGILR